VTTITITAPAGSRVSGDGIRTYPWHGRDLLSVTSAFKKAGLSHRVHTWAISQVVARATGEADILNAMLTRERRPRERVLEKNRIAEASSWLRSAATEERDRKANIGSAVHEAAALALRPDDIPDVMETIKDGRPIVIDGHEVRTRLAQFHHWLHASGAVVLAQEFQVFNLTAGYGGSGDILVAFTGGRVALVDLKTGNSVLSEHVLQLHGYAGAEFSGRLGEVDDQVTGLLRSVTDLGILHLAGDHWEYLGLRDDDTAFPAFLGALTHAPWLSANGEIETCITARRTNRIEAAA